MKLLDTSTHTPLLLYLLERHEPDDEDFVQAISDIESFVVRRFVCGLTTQGYNRIFLERLLVEMGQEGKSVSATLRAKLLALSGPSQRWPNNEEFEAAWLVRRLYQGANTRRVRAVLEGLEAGLKSHKTDKEFLLDDISVEHVMPQKWETHYPLKPDTPENRLQREDLIHSIGNLTLVTSSFKDRMILRSVLQDVVDDRDEIGEALARTGPGRDDVVVVCARGVDGLALVPVKPDIAAKEAGGIGSDHALIGKLAESF